MQKMKISEIVKITGGTLLKKGQNAGAANKNADKDTQYENPSNEPHEYVFNKDNTKKGDFKINSISTDTRKIVPGSLFVALCGKNFNGHDFIEQAVQNGASAVCISDETKLLPGDYVAILVEDTLKAYQDIAMAVRGEMGYPVVCVTGSVGKTSTRQMIAAALSLGLKVHGTKENFNNEIGLPQTLLEAPDDTQVCIAEMGMRGVGEIRELTLIAKPDIAVITNIGIAHIERLGSLDEILKAKTEIVEGLKEGGLLVLNANDLYLSAYCDQVSTQYRIALVSVECDISNNAEFMVRGYNLRQTSASVTFDVEIKSFKGIPVVLDDLVIPVPGAHNVTNALIGIAVAVELDMNLLDVIHGLAKYQAVGNRQRIISHQTLTIIDDSYNAGLESTLAAITMLSDIACGRRKIAVLGDMLELGKFSAYAHQTIGEACVEKKIDVVFACGQEVKNIQNGIDAAIVRRNKNTIPVDENEDEEYSSTQFHYFETREELTAQLCKFILPDDVILIKGSRALAMENVTKAIEEQVNFELIKDEGDQL